MKNVLFVLLCGLVTLGAYAQVPASVEGTVTVLLMDHLQVKSADGVVHTVVLPAGVAVSRRVTVEWTDIHPGDWVGIDSKPGADGSQESVSVNVFSPSMVGRVRKGQFPMASGDLMTNAVVDQVTHGASGDGLVLKSADAMVPFRITSTTVVHRMVDAAVSDLKSGTPVSVRGTANADGSVQATLVSIVPVNQK